MTNIAQDVEPHLPRLRRYAQSLARSKPAADDLVQATVLRALERQHLYCVDTNLSGWLMTIMHNEHFSEMRRQQRRPSALPEDALDELATASNQEATVELRELWRAVALLPPHQREPLLMHWIDGRRYDEIAARLGVPFGTVQSRISRARKTLRTLLADPAARVGLAQCIYASGRSGAVTEMRGSTAA
jgi:RNA polymerase sigma-70 factor (ECF subfamily)